MPVLGQGLAHHAVQANGDSGSRPPAPGRIHPGPSPTLAHHPQIVSLADAEVQCRRVDLGDGHRGVVLPICPTRLPGSTFSCRDPVHWEASCNSRRSGGLSHLGLGRLALAWPSMFAESDSRVFCDWLRGPDLGAGHLDLEVATSTWAWPSRWATASSGSAGDLPLLARLVKSTSCWARCLAWAAIGLAPAEADPLAEVRVRLAADVDLTQGVGQVGRGLGDLGLGRHQIGLVGRILQREENLPPADAVALLEVEVFQGALDPGPDVHVLAEMGLGRPLPGGAQRLSLDPGDHDLGGRWPRRHRRGPTRRAPSSLRTRQGQEDHGNAGCQPAPPTQTTVRRQDRMVFSRFQGCSRVSDRGLSIWGSPPAGGER